MSKGGIRDGECGLAMSGGEGGEPSEDGVTVCVIRVWRRNARMVQREMGGKGVDKAVRFRFHC